MQHVFSWLWLRLAQENFLHWIRPCGVFALPNGRLSRCLSRLVYSWGESWRMRRSKRGRTKKRRCSQMFQGWEKKWGNTTPPKGVRHCKKHMPKVCMCVSGMLHSIWKPPCFGLGVYCNVICSLQVLWFAYISIIFQTVLKIVILCKFCRVVRRWEKLFEPCEQTVLFPVVFVEIPKVSQTDGIALALVVVFVAGS